MSSFLSLLFLSSRFHPRRSLSVYSQDRTRELHERGAGKDEEGSGNCRGGEGLQSLRRRGEGFLEGGAQA